MLNACTIIACNYLPFAKVLTDSFLAHHPDGRFTVLLVDDEQRGFDSGPGSDDRVTWLRLGDIGLDTVEIRAPGRHLRRHRARNGGQARSFSGTCSTAGSERGHLSRPRHPDLRFARSRLPDLAAAHGIVLTPHTTRPYPQDDRDIDAFFVLAAGVYNLGFIAVGGVVAAVSRLVVAADETRGAGRRCAHDVHRPAMGGLRSVVLRPSHPQGPRLQRRLLESPRARVSPSTATGISSTASR